jgi:hypothetical protein
MFLGVNICLVNHGVKKIEMSSIIIKASFKDLCGFIIPRKLFWIFTTPGFFIQILTVNNNKLFPIIFWIFVL